MKRCKTILKTIDNLQKELETRFTADEIVRTIDLEEAKGNRYYGGCDGLIYVIYEGAQNNIYAEEIEKESKNDKN